MDRGHKLKNRVQLLLYDPASYERIIKWYIRIKKGSPKEIASYEISKNNVVAYTLIGVVMSPSRYTCLLAKKNVTTLLHFYLYI